MVGWHHRLDGHGFGWTLGVGDGQGGLACYSSWGHKESDTIERLNWTERINFWCNVQQKTYPNGFKSTLQTRKHFRKFIFSKCLFSIAYCLLWKTEVNSHQQEKAEGLASACVSDLLTQHLVLENKLFDISTSRGILVKNTFSFQILSIVLQNKPEKLSY